MFNKRILVFLLVFSLLSVSVFALTNITNCTGLQGMNNDTSEDYELINDIDCSETINWNNGTGFAPIGDFTGTFNGNGYNVSNIFTNQTSFFTGMFSRAIDSVTIENFNLINITSISTTGGGDYVAGLLARTSIGGGDVVTIRNVNVQGYISGEDNYLGGFIAYTNGGTVNISNCTFEGNIEAGTSSPTEVGGFIGAARDFVYISDSVVESATLDVVDVVGGDNQIGGLIGNLRSDAVVLIDNVRLNNVMVSNLGGAGDEIGGIIGGTDGGSCSIYISDSNFNGTVEGNQFIGGIVGYNICPTTITRSYAIGDINGSTYVGGLIGYNNQELFLNESFFIGNVYRGSNLGGLIGDLVLTTGWDVNISNVYSIADIVSGTSYVAGLIGQVNTLNYPAFMSNAYTVSNTSAGTYEGGIIGRVYPTATNFTYENLFWNNETNTEAPAGVGSPLTNDNATPISVLENQDYTTFTDAGWDFDNVWGISPDANGGFPFLRNNPFFYDIESITDLNIPSVPIKNYQGVRVPCSPYPECLCTSFPEKYKDRDMCKGDVVVNEFESSEGVPIDMNTVLKYSFVSIIALMICSLPFVFGNNKPKGLIVRKRK